MKVNSLLFAVSICAAISCASPSRSAEVTVSSLLKMCNDKDQTMQTFCGFYLSGMFDALQAASKQGISICPPKTANITFGDLPIVFSRWAVKNKQYWDQPGAFAALSFSSQWPCV